MTSLQGRGIVELVEAEVVVEAAPEVLILTQALFAELETLARPDAILASNTSRLPITEIAARTRMAHRGSALSS